jgi:hypothetical protein
VSTYRDPIEDQYPRRSQCPACKAAHPVHTDGEHIGKIVEHNVIDTQISGDDWYTSTVTYACPGSLASVSKWKRITQC